MRCIGHSFSSSLLPDMEGVMHEEVLNLLRAMDVDCGAETNMLHRSRMLALDITADLGMKDSSRF